MPNQTNSGILVAIKRETVTGTAATAASAQQLRIKDSPGLELKRAVIQSAEKRADGAKSMGRIGGKQVDGSFNSELSVGGATDIIIEAIMRAVWSPALVITQATAGLTSITTTTSTIVAAAGSWITAGVKAGDIATLTGHATTANNDLRLRIVTVSALTLTVAGTPLTVDAGPDATFTLTVLKKVFSAATPTRYSHTIEQNDTVIDLSELFLGCRAIGVKLSMKPGQMVMATYSFMGMDRTQLVTGTSPWFTTPTLTTSLGLIADDMAIRFNGAEVAHFTGFDLDLVITAGGQPVIGSFVSPDVFDNDLMISGSVTAIRQSFANLILFDAETEFEVSGMFQEPGVVPKACFGFFLPRVKIQQLSAPVGGGDGAKLETLGLMMGPKVAATGYDATTATFFSSAA